MTGPWHELAAGTARRGHMRASHADRDQVIDVLKTAFVHGRLDKHELDQRVGEALVSRTYAELATLTADIPSGLTRTRQSMPVRKMVCKPVLHRGASRIIMAASVLYACMWVYLLLSLHGGDDGLAFLLAMTSTFIYCVVVAVAGAEFVAPGRQRSRRRHPPRSASTGGGGGQAARHLPSVRPAHQRRPAGGGPGPGAQAARTRRPRPDAPASRRTPQRLRAGYHRATGLAWI
jgi:hypothetical protein